MEGLIVTCEAHPGEGKHWMRATCVRPWLWEIWDQHFRWRQWCWCGSARPEMAKIIDDAWSVRSVL